MMTFAQPASLLSVLIASVASMVLGFLWYSPVLFGTAWMKLKGFTQASLKDAQKKMGPMYTLSFIGAFVMAWVLSMVISLVGVADAMEAARVAFWMWLGFVAPVQMTGVIFGDKKWKLFGIDTGYQLASLLAMAVVIFLWG